MKNIIELDTFKLKIIALVCMIIDHIGAIFFPNIIFLRIIGRIAFPIYAFLIVEGFFYTRNVKKYMLRLGIFALISEIPFDLAFYNKIFGFEHQNIFFTLLFGIIMLFLIEKDNKPNNRIIYFFVIGILAEILSFDYGLAGILMIFVFYAFKNNNRLKTIFIIVVNSICMGINIQLFGSLAMIPILLYNGKKGKNMKFFFYIIYPLHLLILYLLKIW